VKRTALALLACATAALAACGGPGYAPGYIEAFDAGRRARTAGRLEEAEQHFALAYRRAGRVKDRDEALFLQARSQEAQGHPEDAARTYQMLSEAQPPGPRGVHARFELARLAGAARGEEAQDALEREVVGRRREKKDWDGLLAALDGLVPPTRGTPMEQPVDMERAKALEARGDLPAALALYLATARAHPYPFGPRTDDALFRASEVEEKLGRHDLAIAHLREMLEPREHSQTVSSYERPKFPAAQMRIALLLRDRKRDHAAARRELHRLVDEFPSSTMRDDALWIAARMARDDGDAGTACDDVERLVETMPDSRYVRCAHLVCADVKPAARECASYLVRELSGEVAGEPGGLVDDEASVREGEQGPGEPAPDRIPDAADP
jgi:tetratricopeptide (TPR) repeat protein